MYLIGPSQLADIYNRGVVTVFVFLGFVLWCLMPLSTIIQLNHGSNFHWWRKPQYQEKTTDLSQITDKLHHINVVSSIPRLSGVQTHNIRGDRH